MLPGANLEPGTLVRQYIGEYAYDYCQTVRLYCMTYK